MKNKRKIMITTAIRAEYNILYPVIKAIKEHPDLELKLVVTGAHLATSFGYTIKDIEKDGFKIDEKIESLLDTDSLSGRAKSLAVQMLGLVDVVKRIKPDIIVAPFDREESLTTAIVGSYLNIPVAHLGCGDRVEGNVDDYIRHAVTKLSHIHFPSTKESAERIIRMGEEEWRVFTVGGAGLDKFMSTTELSKEDLSKLLNFDISKKPLIVLLQHPVSSEVELSTKQIKITLEALKELKYNTIIIKPNSDSGSRKIINEIDKCSSKYDFMKSYITLERDIFVNLFRHADVLVGNSSCGIIEAPLLKLPVVNIGLRQRGRLHADNVIFVSNDKEKIKNAVNMALFDKDFLKKVQNCKNPYGDGKTGPKVAEILSTIKLDKTLLQKKISY